MLEFIIQLFQLPPIIDRAPAENRGLKISAEILMCCRLRYVLTVKDRNRNRVVHISNSGQASKKVIYLLITYLIQLVILLLITCIYCTISLFECIVARCGARIMCISFIASSAHIMCVSSTSSICLVCVISLELSSECLSHDVCQIAWNECMESLPATMRGLHHCGRDTLILCSKKASYFTLKQVTLPITKKKN